MDGIVERSSMALAGLERDGVSKRKGEPGHTMYRCRFDRMHSNVGGFER